MKNKLPFGIGCFHFGLIKETPFQFKFSEYITELKENLQNISNISNIKIDYIVNDEDAEITIDEEITLRDGPGFYPHPEYLEIEFDIHLPSRFQKDLLLKKYPWANYLNNLNENYKIIINYTYHFPVTFVISLDNFVDVNPSTFIIIMREFFKRELENGKGKNLRFEFLGPSPFHADCYVEAAEDDSGKDENWIFYSKTNVTPRYDKIYFYYNIKLIKEPLLAFNAIKDEIIDELGFYYYLIQVEVVRGRKYYELSELVEKLINLQRKKGLRGFFRRLFLSSKILNETFINITQFESQEIFIHNNIDKNYREVLSSKTTPIFKIYIDNEIHERYNYPIKQLNQLITLFESRRTKGLEISMLLISAIIGGIIGSIITKIMK